ncbi:MAG: fibronectin type III domain-containing protein [Synergistaceae bacterium]|nr:fibronectin type III domain-containing protein [Synergistaceae bacterium]
MYHDTVYVPLEVLPNTPLAPTNVRATPGDRKATISFNLPADDGGVAITEYIVEWSAASGTPNTSSFDAFGAASGLSLDGLTNGVTYSVKVKAVNSVGASDWSSSVSVTPQTIPGAPQDVTAVAGNGEATVSFEAPTDDGGAEITGYAIEWSANGITNTTDLFEQTSYTLNNLTNGVEYSIRVKAVNRNGDAWSAAVSVKPATIPGKPQDVTAVPGNRTVTVSFSAPNNGGEAITSYILEWSANGAVNSKDISASETSYISYTLNNLTNGDAYSIKVKAVNSVGASDWSDSVSVTPSTVPGMPQSVSATAGDGSATVYFSEPESDGGSAITGYVVTPIQNSTLGAEIPVTSSPYTVGSLTNGTEYTFKVEAVNGVGRGPAAVTAAVTPSEAPSGDTVVPEKPKDATAVAGDGEVTITFDAPEGTVTGYVITIYVPDENRLRVQVGEVTAETSPATVTGLTNGTEYFFAVKAWNYSAATNGLVYSDVVWANGGTSVKPTDGTASDKPGDSGNTDNSSDTNDSNKQDNQAGQSDEGGGGSCDVAGAGVFALALLCAYAWGLKRR